MLIEKLFIRATRLLPGATGAYLLLAGTGSMAQADIVIAMNLVNEKGVVAPAGQVTASKSMYGLVFTPALRGLTPGLHGFHLHESPSCEPGEKDGMPVAAQAAGGHYDPMKSKRHAAPWGGGHLGDLPALYVDAEGTATQPVLAPRVRMADLKGRALVIHAGGDNYADHPAPLGGGGARVACGVIR